MRPLEVPLLRLLRAAALTAALVVVSGCAVVNILRSGQASAADTDRLYEVAREHFRAERWKDAEEAFAAVYRADEEGPLATDARFYEAESRYGRGKYDGAFELYKRYVASYPLSQHAPVIQQRLYDMGTFTLDGGRGTVLGMFSSKDAGVDVLDYLVTAFPNGDLADDALMRMAVYEVADGRPNAAITRLHDLIDYYPGSEWALKARLELARAYRSVNRGSDYDADALRRSAAQYRTYVEIVTADAARAEDHAADLAAARAELADTESALARKLLDSAAYYRKTGQEDAADAQLRNLLRAFPDSDAADEARSRLGISQESRSPDVGLGTGGRN